MTKTLPKESLRRVVACYYIPARHDFEAKGGNSHIYHDLQKLRQYLEGK